MTAQERLEEHLADYRKGNLSGEDLVIDLLASLRHFAEIHCVNFYGADEIAHRHYLAERDHGLDSHWLVRR